MSTTTQTDQTFLLRAIALSDRRIDLGQRTPPCPKCGEARQIQLVEWTGPGPALGGEPGPAQWRCRSCWHAWEGEV